MALVFIVEDDNDIRQIEAYALKCGGFEIEEFEDAKALYERLEKKTPDLFLLDVMLPDEDGLEIVKKLRAMPQTKHLPVMMVTAKTTELDKVRGLDIGPYIRGHIGAKLDDETRDKYVVNLVFGALHRT